MTTEIEMGSYAKAFRAICNHLEASDLLTPLGITWRTWKGEEDDEAPPDDGSTRWCRLSFVKVGGVRKRVNCGGEIHSLVPCAVLVELAVDGSASADLTAFWGRIQRALWPSDPAERRTLATWLAGEGGISSWQLGDPALPASAADHSGGQVVASGRVDLTIWVQT